MRIRLSMPSGTLTPEAINAALEAVTLTNESLLQTGKYPTAKQAIAGGVRWKAEPPGDEHFDIAPTVLGRMWGDCDDLAPYHAASLRVTGEDEEARAIVKKTGPKRWHALVQRSDGSIDDPSKWAGMPSKGKGPRFAPVLSPLVVGGIPEGRLAVHTAPFKGQRYARVDIPHMVPCDMALASCARGANEQQALLRALQGARVMGEAICCGPDTMGRIVGAEALLTCETPEDVYRVLRGLDFVSPQLAEDVVGFLGTGSLFDAAGKMAGGALKASPLGSLFGGGGAPPIPAGGGAAPGGGAGGGWGPSGGGGSKSGRGGANNWLINTPPPIIVRY